MATRFTGSSSGINLSSLPSVGRVSFLKGFRFAFIVVKKDPFRNKVLFERVLRVEMRLCQKEKQIYSLVWINEDRNESLIEFVIN